MASTSSKPYVPELMEDDECMDNIDSMEEDVEESEQESDVEDATGDEESEIDMDGAIDEEIQDTNTRETKDVDLIGTIFDEDVLHYTAGLIDTDGTFQVIDGSSVIISVTQAEKGVEALYFLYEHFGGRIGRQLRKIGEHQAAYAWYVLGDKAIQMAKLLINKLYVKNREALVFVEFPMGNLRFIQVKVTNKNTNEVKYFDFKKAGVAFVQTNNPNEWIIEHMFTEEEIITKRDKRKRIISEMQKMKKSPHDAIPDTAIPPHSYFAGVVDGDGCLDVYCKYSHRHNVTQKDRPLLEMMERIYRGHIYLGRTKWVWEIELFGDEFFDAIYPFIVGKKKQADLIKNMKPGEAQIIHAKLRDLKGNFGGNTCRIEATLAGKDPMNYKTETKELPKGVHEVVQKNGQIKYHALIRRNNVNYTLGYFNTIEESSTIYKKYKKLIDDEKRGGAQIDLSGFKKENKPVQPDPPQAFYDEKIKGIHLTASKTFQVKFKKVAIGTYKDYYEAKAVRLACEERDKNEPRKVKPGRPVPCEEFLREKIKGMSFTKAALYRVQHNGRDLGRFKEYPDAKLKLQKYIDSL